VQISTRARQHLPPQSALLKLRRGIVIPKFFLVKCRLGWRSSFAISLFLDMGGALVAPVIGARRERSRARGLHVDRRQLARFLSCSAIRCWRLRRDREANKLASPKVMIQTSFMRSPRKTKVARSRAKLKSLGDATRSLSIARAQHSHKNDPMMSGGRAHSGRICSAS